MNILSRKSIPVFVLLSTTGCLAQEGETAAPALETATTASYGLGLGMGRTYSFQAPELDLEALIEGLRDGFAGSDQRFSDVEIQQALQTFQQEVNVLRQAELEEAAEKNIVEGREFLEANSQRLEVVTLDSGLQYEVLRTGDGPMPTASDTVTVHYRGTLVDGTEFDSSYQRGAPATFAVTGVIAGWTEALQRMTVGSQWKLYVPSSLGYGEQGSAPVIGPNATLIFDVELLEIAQ